MEDIPARDLRNDVSAVLRRVESGQTLRILVSGRPVAELSPISRRPRSIPWEEFERRLAGHKADQTLASELAELLPDTTDDLP